MRPCESSERARRRSRDLDLALHALRGMPGDRALEGVGAFGEGVRLGVAALTVADLQLGTLAGDLERVVEGAALDQCDRQCSRRGLDGLHVEADVVRAHRDLAAGGGLRDAAAATTAARARP